MNIFTLFCLESRCASWGEWELVDVQWLFILMQWILPSVFLQFFFFFFFYASVYDYACIIFNNTGVSYNWAFSILMLWSLFFSIIKKLHSVIFFERSPMNNSTVAGMRNYAQAVNYFWTFPFRPQTFRKFMIIWEVKFPFGGYAPRKLAEIIIL